MDRGAWRATVHRVAKNRARLNQLSPHIPPLIPEPQSRAPRTASSLHTHPQLTSEFRSPDSRG